MSSIKLAIVGYRDYTNYEEFKKSVDEYITELKVNEIVSGGCRGTDTMAEEYAKEKGIQMVVFKPNWIKYPWAESKSLAYTMRDQEIAKYCTHMIAFPSKEKGKGTQITIGFAEKLKKPCKVINI